jgi:hypothetical protein
VRRALAGPLPVLLAALVVLAAAAVLLSGGRPSDTDPSSRSAGNAGTLALHDWLAGLGMPVQRMSGQFSTAGADVLVVAEPTTAFTAEQAAQVVEMLRGGGELVLAGDRAALQSSAELLGALGLVQIDETAMSAQPAAFDAVPVAPVDPAGLARRVPMQAGLAFDLGAPSSTIVPLLAYGGASVGAVVTVGSGHAYVLGSPYPLANLGLRQGDTVPLLLALIDRARGGRVVFDEYHHGEAGVGGAQAALSGPVGLAGALVAMVVLGYLLLSGRRLGRAVPATDPARVPSAGEYIDAMGALFERTARRGGVAHRYAEELKQRVGAATAIDPRLDDEAFLALLEGYDAEAAVPVRAALRHCRELAGARPTGAQLVALARQVDEVESAYAVGAGMGRAEFNG